MPRAVEVSCQQTRVQTPKGSGIPGKELQFVAEQILNFVNSSCVTTLWTYSYLCQFFTVFFANSFHVSRPSGPCLDDEIDAWTKSTPRRNTTKRHSSHREELLKFIKKTIGSQLHAFVWRNHGSSPRCFVLRVTSVSLSSVPGCAWRYISPIISTRVSVHIMWMRKRPDSSHRDKKSSC